MDLRISKRRRAPLAAALQDTGAQMNVSSVMCIIPTIQKFIYFFLATKGCVMGYFVVPQNMCVKKLRRNCAGFQNQN